MDISEKVDQQYKLVEEYNSAKEKAEKLIDVLSVGVDEYGELDQAGRYDIVKEMEEVIKTIRDLEVKKGLIRKLLKG